MQDPIITPTISCKNKKYSTDSTDKHLIVNQLYILIIIVIVLLLWGIVIDKIKVVVVAIKCPIQPPIITATISCKNKNIALTVLTNISLLKQ